MTKPNELSKQEMLERMIRVDHAGEYGAKRIYEGQLAVLKNSPKAPEIEHMLEQELVHLSAFDELIKQRRIRPTAMMPIWHLGGYALGAVTAMMGEKAAMACTVAVETVIGEHYAKQEESLAGHDDEVELRQMIGKFREEELEHQNTALASGAEDAANYPILKNIVENITKSAIWVSKRV